MSLPSKYRLGRTIGGGGMAEVIEAEVIGAQGFSRRVAIKRILGPLSAEPRFSELFANEARLASLLHHPNVVSVLDFDTDAAGAPYLVMELVRGVDLRQLGDTGRLPVALSVHIACEVLRGLAYAHELVEDGRHLGIVHRDVSPHNVMLAWSGSVKLVDFGIAKAVAATGASRSGSLVGKVGYMSPEQAHGSDIDGRSDVFAVGVILHELLTGERLFDGATEPEVLARLLTQPIPRPSQRVSDVPPVVDGAVMQMLERDAAERIPSARLALEALLASGASGNRSREDLRELLRSRFPARAPAEADLSGPAVLPDGRQTPSAPVPKAVFAPPSSGNPVPRPIGAALSGVAETRAGATTPLGPGGAPARVTATPVMPSADPGTMSFGPAAAAPAGAARRRRWPLVAGLGLVAAAVVVIALIRGGAGDARVVGAVGDAKGEASTEDRGTGGAKAKAEAEAEAEAKAKAEAEAEAEAEAKAKADGDARPEGSESESPENLKRSDGARDHEEGVANRDHREGGEAEAKADAQAKAKADGAGKGKRRGTSVASRRPGSLRVIVEPWALVKVNGVARGQTPVVLRKQAAGRYRVEIDNPDLGKRETVRVRIRPGRETVVRRKWGVAF